MRRREFITLLGGAAATWPLAARAQQAERVRRIGVLMNLAADDPEGQARVTAFLLGLQSGWTESRNVRIDTRWGGADAERIRRYAAELIALAPDVIMACRARPHGLRGRAEWRPDLDGEPAGGGSSRSDRRACGPAQTARGLHLTLLRHWRRSDLLRA